MKLFKGVKLTGFTKPKGTEKKPKQAVQQGPQEAAEQTRARARQLIYQTKAGEVKKSQDGQPAETLKEARARAIAMKPVAGGRGMRITPKMPPLR